MLEKDIEKAFVKRIKQLGGLCEKFSSPNRRGVPDRIISLPGGKIVFCELKRPGKKPTPLQLRDHARRKALNCDVRVIDSLKQVRQFPNVK